MSNHICAKCGKQGDVDFRAGERVAYQALCQREDCPQNRRDFIGNLFAAIPPIKGSGIPGEEGK